MKRLFYSLSLVVVALAVLNSCDNGNADTIVFDSAPTINIVSPGNFVLQGNDFNLVVEFKDGVEELSRSPLSSASYSIMESDSATIVAEGDFDVSGISTTTNVLFDNTLAPGDYFFNILASDTEGMESVSYKEFKVIANFNSVGIIGSATPGGWDSDTNMTQDAGNPALWIINSITLTGGEAKFRANDSWSVNWGANTFPTGTGTQDGPNIPVTAGTYKVTLDVTNGAYKFE